jgi:type I restriction enzyme S subunit
VQRRINIGSTVDRLPLTDFPQFPVRIPDLPTQRKIAAILSAYGDLIETNNRRIRLLEEMTQRIYQEWFVDLRYSRHEGPTPQSVPLSDVAIVEMGLSPRGATYNSDGLGVPLLNGPTEFGSAVPTPRLFTTDPKRFAEPGDILFCVRGSTTGRMNWADQRYAIGRGIAAIRGRDKNDTRFVRACIDQLLPSMLQQASGSTFPNLAKDQIAGLRVPRSGDELRLQFGNLANPMLTLSLSLTAANEQLRQAHDLLLPRLISGDVDVEGLDIEVPEAAA